MIGILTRPLLENARIAGVFLRHLHRQTNHVRPRTVQLPLDGLVGSNATPS